MLLREIEVIVVFLVCKDQEGCLDILDQRDHLVHEDRMENPDVMDKKDQKEPEEFKAYLDTLEHLVFLEFLDKLEHPDPPAPLVATEQREKTDHMVQMVFPDDPVYLETVA